MAEHTSFHSIKSGFSSHSKSDDTGFKNLLYPKLHKIQSELISTKQLFGKFL